MKRFFKTRYRIILASVYGYRAQVKVWWFPWWSNCYGSFCSTVSTIEEAKDQIARYKQTVVWEEP